MSLDQKNGARLGLISPVSSCTVLGEDEQLKFKVYNSGNSEISHVSITSRINDEPETREDFMLNKFLPGQSVDLSFKKKASLSTQGLHHVKAKLCLEPSSTVLDSIDVRLYSGPFLVDDRLSYILGFEETEEFPGTKSEDTNKDGETWEGNKRAHAGKLAACMRVNPADDWYFTHCIQLEAGEQYVISYFCNNPIEHSISNLEVGYGKMQTASSMTQLLLTRSLKKTGYQQDSIVFNAYESGSFYVGFHCKQSDGKGQLLIDDIRITKVEKEPGKKAYAELYKVFPNPTTGSFRIQGGNGSNGGKIVIIRNAFGEKIYQKSLSECMSNDIDFDSRAAGIYLLEIIDKNDKTLFTTKFILQ